MKLFSTQSPRVSTIIILFILINSALWAPAIFIPFWGDDYYFLVQARESRLNNESWLMPFYSESSTGFWRPLSMDVAWRIIEGHLDADPVKAHFFSFLIWFISIVCVYLLTLNISRSLRWEKPIITSLVASSFYSFSAVHFLVLHWVSAINSSFLIIFISLALSVWVAITSLERRRIGLSCLLVAFLILALFSKESAVLTPALMLCLSIFIGRAPKSADVILLFVCIIICSIWFYFFQQFTYSISDSYELVVGLNIVQNTATLMGWLLNIPRESMRMLLDGRIISALVWITPILFLMLTFLVSVFGGAKINRSKNQLFGVIGFLLFGYAPYFLLVHQSYEYYAAVSIILPIIFATRCLMLVKSVRICLLIFAAASFCSVQVSRMLDYPSLIGRAHWAETQLGLLQDKSVEPPILLNIRNEHRFYSIGSSGLIWRLGLGSDEIIFGRNCIDQTQQMLTDFENHLELRSCR